VTAFYEIGDGEMDLNVNGEGIVHIS